MDTQVREIGKPYSWKAPFGRLEYSFPDSLSSPGEEFIGTPSIGDQSSRLSLETYNRSASPENSDTGSLVPDGSLSDHPRWNTGGPSQTSLSKTKKTVRIAVSLDSLSTPVSPSSFLSPNWHASQSVQRETQVLKQHPEEPKALHLTPELPQISAPVIFPDFVEGKTDFASQSRGSKSEDPSTRDASQIQIADNTVHDISLDTKPIQRKMSRGVKIQKTQRPPVKGSSKLEPTRPEPTRQSNILRTPGYDLEVSELPPKRKEITSTTTPVFTLSIGLDHLQSQIMTESRGRKNLGLKIPTIFINNGSTTGLSFQERFGKDLDSLISHAMDSNLAGTLKVGKYNLLRHLEKDRTNTKAQLLADSPVYSRSKPLQIHGKNFANAMVSVSGVDSKRLDSMRNAQEGERFLQLTSSLFSNFFDTQQLTSRIGTAKLYWVSVNRILSSIEVCLGCEDPNEFTNLRGS